MKVGLNGAAAAQLPAETNVRPAANTSVQNTQAVTTDRTTLKSDQAVQALTQHALQSPEIRESTVSALRQSVSNGTYHPDASRTATAISQEG